MGGNVVISHVFYGRRSSKVVHFVGTVCFSFQCEPSEMVRRSFETRKFSSRIPRI